MGVKNDGYYYEFLMNNVSRRDPEFLYWAFERDITNWRDVDDVCMSASKLNRNTYRIARGIKPDEAWQNFMLRPVNVLEFLMTITYTFAYNSKAEKGDDPYDSKRKDYIFWTIVKGLGFLEFDGNRKVYWDMCLKEVMEGKCYVSGMSSDYRKTSVLNQTAIFLNELHLFRTLTPNELKLFRYEGETPHESQVL